MNTNFKIFTIHIIRCFLKVFWLYRIQDNKVLFDSFGAKQYSDSPKYISEYIQKYYPNMKIVWVLNSPEKFDGIIPDDVECVCSTGWSFYRSFFSSKAIVTNNYIPTYLPVRKNQILLNTWHGGGNYKKNGLSVSSTKYDHFFANIQSDETTAYISSSKAIDDLVIDKSFDFHKEILRIGMPRNAMLLRENPMVREKIYKHFNIPDNKAIIIYAPTFRGTANEGKMLDKSQMFEIRNVLDSFKKKTGREYVFIFRAHHTFKSTFHGDEFLDASEYPDMQELLYSADILITDYSSCMWDMALTKKPIFLYSPDADEWLSKTGFYGDYYQLPFPIAKSEKELINNIIYFNKESYDEKVQKHLDELGSYERDDSDKLASEWLIKKMTCK